MHAHVRGEFHMGRGEEDDERARPQVEDDDARAHVGIAHEHEKGTGRERRDGGHDRANAACVELIEKYAGSKGARCEDEARP